MRWTVRLIVPALLALMPSLAMAQGGPPPLQTLGPPPVPAQNPLTPAKVSLGMALFWDEQLSLTQTVACGTCHAPTAGGSDPRSAAATPNTHPGPDGVFGTADDVVGASGVPLHGADGRYLDSASFGLRPQVGSRQSISVVNAAYVPELFWDGRAGISFRDPQTQQLLIASGGALENQALGPLVNSAEMAHSGGTLADMQLRIADVQPLALAASIPATLSSFIDGRSYPALFAEAFGDGSISSARIAMALASYQRTLIANQTPLDAQLSGTGTLTPQEQQGRQLYTQFGCQACHGGALLSDNAFHYTGVRPQAADPGRFAVTGLNADRGRLRSPGLRNIELTAPYMADGRFATLEEVIDFYARGGDFNAPNLDPRIVPFNINAGQRAALAAFMRRPLTDPRLATQAGPFERPTLFSETDAVPATVGVGQSGSGGLTPRLIAIEPPLAGGDNFTIAVEGGLANATAQVLIDLIEPTSPSSPSLLQQSFALSAQGSASVNLTLPSDALLAGQTLFLCVFVADAVGSGGFSATRSVQFKLLGLGSTEVFHSGFE